MMLEGLAVGSLGHFASGKKGQGFGQDKRVIPRIPRNLGNTG